MISYQTEAGRVLVTDEKLYIKQPLQVPLGGLADFKNSRVNNIIPQRKPQRFMERLLRKPLRYTDPLDYLKLTRPFTPRWNRKYTFYQCRIYIVDNIPIEAVEFPNYIADFESCDLITLCTNLPDDWP